MIFTVACERRKVELFEWHAASYPELFESPPPADPIACRLALLSVDQVEQSGTVCVPSASSMSSLLIMNLAQEMK